jgi:hypothetical protein
MTDQIQLAAFLDCKHCQGKGTRTQISSDRPRRQVDVDCHACKGQGHVPTYIPIDRLLDQGVAMPALCAIRDYMNAIDDLAAQLDASGLVEEPPKVSSIEDRVRAKAWPEHPAKTKPPNPCPTCGRIAWKWNATVEKWACEPCSALYERKETPDLAEAAKALVAELQNWHPVQTRRAGKTKLMQAIVEVKECLDGRGCALPRTEMMDTILAGMDRWTRHHGLEFADPLALLVALLDEPECLAYKLIAGMVNASDMKSLRESAQGNLHHIGVLAAKAQHMCGPCNGTGEVQGVAGAEICSGCSGSGAADR